ncbi:TlpA family protein disulfide reductase [Mucilaginibacter sp. SJ]|uniref:TlpA family protein disulfide reductase n=1 Tax=Mucilaginibacter sp. SJ TaxID=3029053 RepID=UPI0023A98E46|nr:TlpA disulfide reductase family protein [Mucilaginibacter sp. SJ]WEA00731.1 TlpA disulfide reductase family protein [Mucilaginibacter sp. SJ]
MKHYLSFLAALCLFLNASARDKSYTFYNKINGLQPGDKVPDIIIKGLTNNNGKSEARISDYRGKLLILDFWATWCVPCVDMISKMNGLQDAYKEKLQIMPVAYQSKTEVETFLGRLAKERGIKEQLPGVMGDTELGKLFPHSELPHLVWIGPDGIVKAITDQRALSNEVINRFLQGGDASLKVKEDEVNNYDHDSNLLIAPTEESADVSFAVSGYITGVGRGYYNNTMIDGEGEDRRITARNQTIPELYLLAYSKQPKEIAFEVVDTTGLTAGNLKSDDFRDWLKKGNGYCVELILPDSLRKKSYQILREKLSGHFTKYTASLETRKVKCLALVRTSNMDKLKSTGQKPAVEQDAFGARFTNCYLRVFISRMQLPLQYHPLPLKDETGYMDKADLQLTGNLTKLDEVNRELAKYDLRFEERLADLEMVVIRDAPNSKP